MSFFAGWKGFKKHAFLIFEKYRIFLIFFIFNFYLFLISSTLRFLNFCTVFVSFKKFDLWILCFCISSAGHLPAPAHPLPQDPKTPCLGDPSTGDPSAGDPSAGDPSAGPPKISLFFLSLGSRFVEFWWCFGLPGCRVKPRRICACIQKKNSNTTEIPREDAPPSSGPHLFFALTFSGCCLCCLCCCFFLLLLLLLLLLLGRRPSIPHLCNV